LLWFALLPLAAFASAESRVADIGIGWGASLLSRRRIGCRDCYYLVYHHLAPIRCPASCFCGSGVSRRLAYAVVSWLRFGHFPRPRRLVPFLYSHLALSDGASAELAVCLPGRWRGEFEVTAVRCDTSLRPRKPALLAFCAGIGHCRARNWCICIHEASCSLAVAVEFDRLLIYLHQPSSLIRFDSCIRSVFCSLFCYVFWTVGLF
jgi:hypothetical protein